MPAHRTLVAPVSRSQIVMTGKDRATLLHKFCTQDVLSRQPAQGGEAFICNVQGKIVAYVYFFVGADEIVLDSAPGQAPALIQHLDRYVITEDVQFRDASDDRATLLLAGPASDEILAAAGLPAPPSELYAHAAVTDDGSQITARRVPFGGRSLFLDVPAHNADTWLSDIAARGAMLATPEEVEALRIESLTPLYGADITVENLPQEVSRDAHAINFRKGCYLGQETVARIDALGHVNKHLVQVKFAPEANLAPGKELRVGDKVVGRVTSACWSTTLGAPLALAYVRREHAAVGTKLAEGEVVNLRGVSA